MIWHHAAHECKAVSRENDVGQSHLVLYRMVGSKAQQLHIHIGCRESMGIVQQYFNLEGNSIPSKNTQVTLVAQHRRHRMHMSMVWHAHTQQIPELSEGLEAFPPKRNDIINRRVVTICGWCWMLLCAIR